MWEFPGGKLHSGESPEACLVREIAEELGLDVVVVRSLGANEHRYPERTVRLLFYEAEPISGRVRLAVHDRFAWVLPEALAGYAFAPADRPLVDQMLRAGGVVPMPRAAAESIKRKRRRMGRLPRES
jgi:8-oxo-dGTP diphosphatase